MIDTAKIPYGRAKAQDAINAVMIEQAKAGKFVVRLKAAIWSCSPAAMGRFD